MQVIVKRLLRSAPYKQFYEKFSFKVDSKHLSLLHYPLGFGRLYILKFSFTRDKGGQGNSKVNYNNFIKVVQLLRYS